MGRLHEMGCHTCVPNFENYNVMAMAAHGRGGSRRIDPAKYALHGNLLRDRLDGGRPPCFSTAESEMKAQNPIASMLCCNLQMPANPSGSTSSSIHAMGFCACHFRFRRENTAAAAVKTIAQ